MQKKLTKCPSSWGLVTLISLLIVSSLSALRGSAEPPEPQRLAVLELKSFGALSPLQLMSLSDKLRAESQRVLGGDFLIMTRENISVLLEDPAVVEACTSDCEIKVGRAIQAHFVLSGLVMSIGDDLSATLKLHRVRDDKLIGIEEATGEDEGRFTASLKQATGRLLLRISTIRGDGGAALVAQSKLSQDELPPLKELSVISRFGLPTSLLIEYDQALKVDEDEDEPIERKIEVWSRLSSYTQHRRLSDQARGRLAYWRARYKRRLACDQMWRDLSPIMSLSRAVSDEERAQLARDFLDECGRTLKENPHIKHPALREELEREERVRREKEEARAREERAERRRARKARLAEEMEAREEDERRLAREERAQELVDELSPLELWLGGGHGVKAEGLSYHFRVRLQLDKALKRSLFLDMNAEFTRGVGQVEDVIETGLGGSLGYQLLNASSWAPSASVGLSLLRGEPYGVGELGLRYLYSPGWLSFALGVQYLKGFGLYSTAAEREREARPEGPLSPVRPHIPNLAHLNGELRVTLWADTSLKGVIIGGLILYALASMSL